nr:hypothetical protein [Tanacetum cinerariifolium]
GLAVGPTSLLVEITVTGGPAVGMKPLPMGTSIPPARIVAASMEEMQAHLLRLEEPRTEQSLLYGSCNRGNGSSGYRWKWN